MSPLRPLSSRAFALGAFSLVELLSVMAVMALLASITIPGVQGVLKGAALRTASERSWSAVASARQEAVSRGAPVAMVLTKGRSASSDKADAFILLVASSSGAGWTWSPSSKWLKLPAGIEVKPEADSFMSSSDPNPPDSPYAKISQALPKIDGEVVTEYFFVVFRPDGSIEAQTSQPMLGLRRLNSSATAVETALVLSPDSGRARLVQL